MKAAGFSLVEVLVATAIVAVGWPRSLSSLLPPHAIESAYYVIVMVAHDSSKNDDDPLMDGHTLTNPGTGVLVLRAEAFGPRGTHQVIARPGAGGVRGSGGVLALDTVSVPEPDLTIRSRLLEVRTTSRQAYLIMDFEPILRLPYV